MKNLLLVLVVSLFTTTAFAKDDGMTVNAANTSDNAIAIGSDTTYDAGKLGSLDVTEGLAVAGSILVNPKDCDCYESLNLVNNATNSIAVGASAAGSIVVR